MVTLKIVPHEDYEILMRYLDEDGVVLLSETVLETFTPEVQGKFRELDNKELDYNFGGEPEVYVDVIRSGCGYTYQTLIGLGEEDGDCSVLPE